MQTRHKKGGVGGFVEGDRGSGGDDGDVGEGGGEFLFFNKKNVCFVIKISSFKNVCHKSEIISKIDNKQRIMK